MIVQVWTGPRCETGAAPLGALAPVLDGRVVEAGAGQTSLQLRITRDVADAAQVAPGRWLWIAHPTRGVSEWPILQVSRLDGTDRDLVTVSAGSLRQALTLRGKVRTRNAVGLVTTSFAATTRSVQAWLREYVFTNLDEDGLAWMQSGTVEYDASVTIGPITNWTRSQVLDELEKATGYEFEFVRIGDSAYRLDFVRARGSTIETALLAPETTITQIEAAADLVSAPSVVAPVTSAGTPMGETWWWVRAISGSGPYWVELVDQAGGPKVIREDGQAVGLFLVPNDGEPLAITDSRAVDSAVKVSSVRGLVIGGLATFWRSASGAYPDEISSPSAIDAVGRVVHSVSVAVSGTAANRISDPLLRTALAGWEVVNPSSGGVDVVSRQDPPTIAMTVNGTVSSGATSVPVTGGPANALIRFGDALVVAGVETAASADALSDNSGNVTVAITPSLSAALASTTVLAWERDGVLIRSVTANGAQSSGATSLTLSGLPTTPQVTAGDTFVYSGTETATLVNGQPNPLSATIASGTTVTVTEQRLIVITLVSGLPIVQYLPVSYAATTTGSAAPGEAVLIDTSGAPPLNGAFVLSQTFAVSQASVVRTYTITGTPAAWSGTGTGTYTISGTVGQAFASGTALRWIRSGTILGDVTLTSARVTGDTTLPLQLLAPGDVLLGGRVLAGDVFRVPSQTLYSDSQVTLNGSGAGMLTLRQSTSGIASGAALAVQRCRDYNDAAVGSTTVIRLRGNATNANSVPSVYRGGSLFGLYSPIMRLGRTATETTEILLRLNLTQWAPEANQKTGVMCCYWDVDTRVVLGSSTLYTENTNWDPGFGTSTHTTTTKNQSRFGFVGIRRVRISLHPIGGQPGNGLGGFTFLRAVSLSVIAGTGLGFVEFDSVDSPPFVVEGAQSNLLWHRANDLLEQRRDQTRYRVELGGQTTPLAFGQSVRVRSAALDVDRTLRVVRLEWRFGAPEDQRIELGTLTPRFSESA